MRLAVMNRAKEAAIAPAKKRRKENYTDNVDNECDREPPHLRGGYLLPAEVKSLTNDINSIDQFKRLGGTITPPSSAEGLTADEKHGTKETPAFSSQETERLDAIARKKTQLSHQISALDDQEVFLMMVRSRAKSVLDELKRKEKSIKDICGFDKRLRWSSEDFDEWRFSESGKEALRTKNLTAPALDSVDAEGDSKMADGTSEAAEEVGRGVCQKKRCQQHNGWYKLHTQGLAFDRSDCRRAMQKLNVEEEGIRERATIRSLESS